MSCIMPSLISGILFVEEDKVNDEGNNCVEKEINTDPWPGYRYTGKLRPHYPLVRTQRTRDGHEHRHHKNCFEIAAHARICRFSTAWYGSLLGVFNKKIK